MYSRDTDNLHCSDVNSTGRTSTHANTSTNITSTGDIASPNRTYPVRDNSELTSIGLAGSSMTGNKDHIRSGGQGRIYYASMDHPLDGDAVNPDLTLKDASQMTWQFDPDSDEPMTPVPVGRAMPDKSAASSVQEKSHKRKKAKMLVGNPFVDIEAKDNDDEEDKGVEEDENDESFIDDEMVANTHRGPLHPRHTLAPVGEFDVLADNIKKRYLMGKLRGVETNSESQAVEFTAPLWEVVVNVGNEQAAVDQILRRIDAGLCGSMNTPRRVFCRSHMPGRLFIQVQKVEDARNVCNGVYGVKSNDVHFVNVIDAAKYLTEDERVETPRVDTWIQMAVAPYVGDLAYVLNVCTGITGEKPQVKVVLLPRLVYSARKCKRGNGHQERPSAIPLNHKLYLDIHGPDSIKVKKNPETSAVQGYIVKTKVKRRLEVSSSESDDEENENEGEATRDKRGRGILREPVSAQNGDLGGDQQGGEMEKDGDEFGQVLERGVAKKKTRNVMRTELEEVELDSGGFFLLKDVAYGNYEPRAVIPSRADIMKFMKCPSIQDLAKWTALQIAELSELKRGDQVKMIEGKFVGQMGYVEEVLPDHAQITLMASNTVIEAVHTSYRRHFQIGDQVRIMSGENQGICGFVTAVDDQIHTVTIWTRNKNDNVFASINDVEFAEDDCIFHAVL
ncbi:hypothetical protein NP233_g13022 [Leucocoprinus birnbaumii]|uniref:KOW domain-containing protein n=1 Tax=Leucocoprinus birnbaumii TaxID=56174 RepID=A0AAD5VDT3_9AGAR|nr:hypothetical protein NP233_g13022 [Leucocoprinus birnbaumii]